tara:strand:- start:5102 stop:5302 length:201 start_codon:yes stop_codon:yes gene_type:complete
MALVELSDLVGALELFQEKYPDSKKDEIKEIKIKINEYLKSLQNITMEDLEVMSHITKRAFQNGRR